MRQDLMKSERRGRQIGRAVVPCLALAVAVGVIPAAAQRGATVACILAANRQAMHDPVGTGTLQIAYAFSGLGLVGSGSRTIELATGAFVESMASGPISLGSGYDGRTPWMRDFSGAFTAEQGGDRPQLAANQTYRFANAWWRPDRGGATIVVAGRDTAQGAPADHLVVTPSGGSAFDAWFDARSHLLVRIGELRGFMYTRVFYSDYAPVAGIMLPRTVVTDLGTGPSSYETLHLLHAQLTPARPATAFARPTAPPTGGSIAGGAWTATVPFQLLNNHIYVDAMVNGRGPFTFIIDTGGHAVISPSLAGLLGSRVAGIVPMSGAGEKTATTGFAQVAKIALGPVELARPTVFVTGVYDKSIEGIRVDGMLGFELFRRFAVRIDYQRQMLTFTDPAHFDARGAGTMMPFRFYDHLPDVQGTIDGRPARFDIDTGSRGELDVTPSFVKAWRMRATYPLGVQAMTGWGVGGAVEDYVVRLASVTLGGLHVDGPVADLSEAVHGSFSDVNYDGNIGSGFLKRFVVTFDYAHQRLCLAPVVPPPADVGTFDRSGMWLNAVADGYQVGAVDQGGPAAVAGLRAGDLITTIDGRPALAAELSAVRARFRTLPAETSVSLHVAHAGTVVTIVLVLRDIIPPPPLRSSHR